MGTLVSRIQGLCGKPYPLNARVVMFGLDGAGKTTILYRMKLNETVRTYPTVAYNVETLESANGMSLTVWDVSTGAKGRPLLRFYLPDSHGMVFVVDSTDVERLDEAEEMLFGLIQDDAATFMPVLVLANKQDLEGARSPSQIALDLKLDKYTYKKCEVHGCCATTGEGLLEAMDKLSEMIKKQETS
ncbi:ADP-ribosylation factor 1-like isoform 1-T2 [Discoglossus pictus]